MIEIVRELETLRRRLATLEVAERGAARGTAFPTGISSGFLFYRSDLGWLCYYDGTRWLSVHEYSSDFTAYPRNAQPFSGASGALLITPLTNAYSVYISSAIAYVDVATTNDGSNYWSLALKSGATTIWSFNTSAIAANTYTRFSSSPAVVLASPTYAYFEATSKTGAPGSLVINGLFYYRLIVT